MAHFSILLGVTLALGMTSSASASAVIYIPAAFRDVKLTHAVTGPLAFALFMPLAAIIIRTLHHRSVVKLHASLMVFAWALSLIALGSGIYMAFYINMLDHPHAVIGYCVIVGCALQPVTGWWHHVLYKKGRANGIENGNETSKLKRSYKVTHTHVWWGRILITLGIINGGLGLQLSRQLYAIDTPFSAEIGYAVGAAMVWTVWVGVLIIRYVKNKGGREVGKDETTFGMQGKNELDTPKADEK